MVALLIRAPARPVSRVTQRLGVDGLHCRTASTRSAPGARTRQPRPYASSCLPRETRKGSPARMTAGGRDGLIAMIAGGLPLGGRPGGALRPDRDPAPRRPSGRDPGRAGDLTSARAPRGTRPPYAAL